MKRLALLLACTAILAACSATPKTQVPITEAGSGSSSGNNGPSTGTIQQVQAMTPDEELLTGQLAKRSIYFDLDSFVVKEEFRPTVEAHAAFMKRNPGRRVSIEGNTDERGSREYNLALGQKRAEAVKSMLRVMGVGETQLEAVSYGEERPKSLGHDESAWADNRRADIVYPK